MHMTLEAVADRTPTKVVAIRTKRGKEHQTPDGSARERKGGRVESPLKPLVDKVVVALGRLPLPASIRGMLPTAPEDSAPTASVGASTADDTLPHPGEAASSASHPPSVDWREEQPDAVVQAAGKLLGDSPPRQCQLDTWKHIRARKDVVLVAATGDGKTLAALLPVLASRLGARCGQGRKQRVLIVSPLNRLITTQLDELTSMLRELGVDGVVASSFREGDKEFDEADAIPDEPDGPPLVSGEDLAALRIGTVERAILDAGKGQCDLVAAVVTPERLCGRRPDGEWTKKAAVFQACCARTGFDLIFVDEAHLIRDWGTDFRQAFLNIGAACGGISDLRDGLLASGLHSPQPAEPAGAAPLEAEPLPPAGPIPIVAATGTLRLCDLPSLVKTLAMREPELVLGDPTSFHRLNINLQVMFAEADEERRSRDAISKRMSKPPGTGVSACAALSRLTRAQDLSLAEPVCATRGIVYITEAGEVDDVAAAITHAFPHIGAVPYAGRGLTNDERNSNYTAWQRGYSRSGLPARLIVATCALGLGLNFACEVELVLHVRVRQLCGMTSSSRTAPTPPSAPAGATQVVRLAAGDGPRRQEGRPGVLAAVPLSPRAQPDPRPGVPRERRCCNRRTSRAAELGRGAARPLCTAPPWLPTLATVRGHDWTRAVPRMPVVRSLLPLTSGNAGTGPDRAVRPHPRGWGFVSRVAKREEAVHPV